MMMMNQQQNAKISKSVSILKQHHNRDMTMMPYDNYLTEKRINIPVLHKQPRDKKVVMDLEKIN